MATKNYKSDFNFILHLYSVLTDSSGKEKERTELPWPDYDWSAKFWTSSKANAYYASCIGGVCANCRNTDGKIQIVVDNHNMGLGTLQVEFRAELPREIYPDGSERNVVPGVLDIELVRGAGDFPSDFEAQLQMPFIKLKYEDLTEEEKAEFQRPVTEATESLQEFQTTAEAAEVKREANEKTRVSAEQTRVTKESERQTAETKRQSNEQERIKAESDREEAETERVSAEEKRAEEFASWETEIDSKADRSELSNVIAEKSDDGAILKERSTGEVMYPHTLASLVQTSTGENVDEAVEVAKFKVFVDMWNEAWGEYGGYDPVNAPDAEHPFMGNEIWMSYEEAINVYYEPLQQPNDYPYKYARKLGMRTNICTFSSVYYETISAKGIAFGNDTLETIRLSSNTQGFWSNNYSSAFRSCPKLKTILPIIYDSYLSKTIWDRTFEGSPLLEHVLISELRSSVSFSQCPKLSLDSLTHLVANAANTAAITITVHPDVYAKLTGDTTNEAAAALTEEELAQWQQVLADAVAKNISFATI